KSTENGLASGVCEFSGGLAVVLLAVVLVEDAQPASQTARRIREAAVAPRRMRDALEGWRRRPGKPRRHTAHGMTATFAHSPFAAPRATSISGQTPSMANASAYRTSPAPPGSA